MHNEEREQAKLARKSLLASIGCGALLASVTLILSVTGPFNTYGLGSFLSRLVYWGGLVFSSFALVTAVKSGADYFDMKSLFWREALIVLAFCLIFTPVVMVWTDMSFPSAAGKRPSAVKILVYLIGICVGMSTFRYGVPILLQSQQEPQPRQSSSVEPVEKSRFVRRLPEEFVGQILRLSGDGHYVNVSTTQGPFDVRIRLSDAVEEMDCDAGFLVHRSHWVAREAIRDAKKERGRPVLILKTGDTVPVGAKYRSQLEEAGIL